MLLTKYVMYVYIICSLLSVWGAHHSTAKQIGVYTLIYAFFTKCRSTVYFSLFFLQENLLCLRSVLFSSGISNDPVMVVQLLLLPWHTRHLSSLASEPRIWSHPTCCNLMHRLHHQHQVSYFKAMDWHGFWFFVHYTQGKRLLWFAIAFCWICLLLSLFF